MGECFYISFVVNGWDWFSVVDSSLSLGGMLEGILLGLLCCKTNDGMSIFLLSAIVYTKEGRGEERLGW